MKIKIEIDSILHYKICITFQSSYIFFTFNVIYDVYRKKFFDVKNEKKNFFRIKDLCSEVWFQNGGLQN